MAFSLKNSRAMTLVEVLVGLALFGIVSVGGVWLMTEKKKAEITGNTEVLAAEMAEEFFKQRAKILATAFEENSGQEISFTDFSEKVWVPSVLSTDPTVRPDREGKVGGNTPYQLITVPSSGCFGPFTETISNVCVPEVQDRNNPNFNVIPTANLNVSGLSGEETDQLTNCASEASASASVPCPYHLMRVRVTRNISGNQTEMNFPLNNQQGVIGAALCIVPNGNIAPRGSAGAYNGINFRLLLLVKDANNRAKLVRKETSFARPRLRVEGSIIPSAIGCDKSQN